MASAISKPNHSCQRRQSTCVSPSKTRATSHREASNVAPRYHCNQQYSVIALTNGGGAITERYAYSAYGTPTITDGAGTTLTTSAENNRYTYTGREYDEALGLYHYRARMYDSVAGRFCSRDPIEYVGSPWNLFEYVHGSPASKRDPSGLSCEVTVRCGEVALGMNHCGVWIDDGTGGVEVGIGGNDTDGNPPNWFPPVWPFNWIWPETDNTQRPGCRVYRAPSAPETPEDKDDYPWDCSQSDCAATKACFENFIAFNPIPPYAAISGPNSNTYAHRMLDACDCDGPTPEDAPNWFHPDGIPRPTVGPDGHGICFTGDTIVSLASGQRVKIADVQPGMLVRSFDLNTCGTSSSEVERLHEQTVRERIFTVQFKSGVIRCTALHPFMVVSAGPLERRKPPAISTEERLFTEGIGQWVCAADLQAGDRLWTLDGDSLEVIVTEARVEEVKVFNLRVRHFHNYFVGESGVLVHNK